MAKIGLEERGTGTSISRTTFITERLFMVEPIGYASSFATQIKQGNRHGSPPKECLVTAEYSPLRALMTLPGTARARYTPARASSVPPDRLPRPRTRSPVGAKPPPLNWRTRTRTSPPWENRNEAQKSAPKISPSRARADDSGFATGCGCGVVSTIRSERKSRWMRGRV